MISTISSFTIETLSTKSFSTSSLIFGSKKTFVENLKPSKIEHLTGVVGADVSGLDRGQSGVVRLGGGRVDVLSLAPGLKGVAKLSSSLHLVLFGVLWVSTYGLL